MEGKPEYNSIHFLVNAVGKAQRGQLNDALGEIGLYAGQEMFLWQLWKEDGLTQSQIAERVCVQPPTVSKMLDRMVGSGLVERRADEEDSRVSRVFLTEKGRQIQEHVREVWVRQEQKMTRGLSSEERDVLRGLLRRVHENLSE